MQTLARGSMIIIGFTRAVALSLVGGEDAFDISSNHVLFSMHQAAHQVRHECRSTCPSLNLTDGGRIVRPVMLVAGICFRASLCQTLEEKGPRMPPPRVDPTREICRYRSIAILEAVCSSEILCRNNILHPSFSNGGLIKYFWQFIFAYRAIAL